MQLFRNNLFLESFNVLFDFLILPGLVFKLEAIWKTKQSEELCIGF
jgi:hypothetical protein